MRTALLAPEPEFDWDAAEAEMDEFLATPSEPDVRPEVVQELVDAGWFDAFTPDWTGALCASHPDPDIWHPQGVASAEKWRQQQLAIGICQSCPIRTRCRQYGVKHMRVGVWGGIALDPAKDPSTPDPRRLATHCRRQHQDWRIRPDGTRICRSCQRDREVAARKAKKNAAA